VLKFDEVSIFQFFGFRRVTEGSKIPKTPSLSQFEHKTKYT
jgi:hypothetical protein